MERFLKIEKGMTISTVEGVLGFKLTIEKQREEHFQADMAHLEDRGVWLFFTPETQELYTIRYEAPFPLAIEGVRIGDTKKMVKELRGKPLRVDPFPYPHSETIWIYGKSKDPDWVRFDFEKKRNGKCITIFR